jgi:hypothetical protein
MSLPMPDATSHSLPREAVSSAPVSEDCRRPRALVPYICLWGATILCVVFALIAMFLQR